MLVGFLHELGVRMRKPAFDPTNRVLDAERFGKDFGIRGQSQESEQHRPSESDGLFAGERGFPPAADDGVVMGSLIERVKQDVQIDKLHLRAANLAKVSSSSRAAASARALSRLNCGRPMSTGFSR